ncbi:YggT family protein [Bacillus sp. FJAT-42376]|uniref:YggT family protein n=1 Tax=Bacillus sp. FJAT-42376 TaxID=2014076 RepID=UPI000F5089B3|nr:YggT family protein [Bacillus sp. FJAT-42376]AZB42853.1 YggT family protein [Bacillus sp. FJAT-42376]
MYLVFSVISALLRVYVYAIIIYILMSWFPNAKDSKFGQILASICEPFLEPFRRIIPAIAMIDLSPIAAILVLNLAQGGVWSLYRMIA